MYIYKNWMKELVIIYIILSTKASLLKSDDCSTNCNEDILVKHLATMEVLSPESIFTLAFDDIGQLCKKLEDNLRTTDIYLKTCKISDQSGLYISLIRGVKALNDKICCPENNFYRRYSKFYLCLKELTSDFESCNGPADWNEESEKEKLCKTYKNIVDCYYIKAAKVCGKAAATIVTELVKDVINSVLITKCNGINSSPSVPDAMPEKYINQGSPNGGLKCSIELTLFTFVIIIVYIMILTK